MAALTRLPLLKNPTQPCRLSRGRKSHTFVASARAPTPDLLRSRTSSVGARVCPSNRSSDSTSKYQRSWQQHTFSVSANAINVTIESSPESPYKGMKALVAGASGGCGRKIVEKLLAEGVPVVALVRDKSKADGILLKEGVELVEGDVYQYQTLPKAVKDCNVVMCATGSRPALDPLGPFNVDYQGTKNLIVAARRAEVEHFVFITSIGTDEILFPLNLFWGVLFWKKRAEEHLQRSGLKYTIVRPGGLKDKPQEGRNVGNVVMKGPNAYGLPPKAAPGGILREQVADVCVNALIQAEAANKIVEIVAEEKASQLTFSQLFASVEG